MPNELFVRTVKTISKQQNHTGKQDENFSYNHKTNSSHLNGLSHLLDSVCTVVNSCC
jgi:hypothetical protein